MKVIVDCDPGNGIPGANVDDAVALTFDAGEPGLAIDRAKAARLAAKRLGQRITVKPALAAQSKAAERRPRGPVGKNAPRKQK